MSFNDSYNQWLTNANNSEILDELKNIQKNETEIRERFYKNIEFGTAGLRGVMGAGTNRINVYTVRQATQGLSNYLNEKFENSSVSISFDSRKNSKKFAYEAAKVLAGNNIKVHISRELQPTPFLSFAVRHFKCQAGIMITASHNPGEYNGYKCYGEDGGQLTDEFANLIYDHINTLDIFKDVKIRDFEQAQSNNLIYFIEDDAYDKYLSLVLKQKMNKNLNLSHLNVTYTPLYGAGNKMVQKLLRKIGVENLNVVKEQEKPDGNFSTCTYPNPETESAFSLALELAKKNQSDIVIATDPDADRLGLCVRQGENYKFLSGNEIGILFLNYILSCKKKLPKSPIIIKTIVSSKMIDAIAKAHNCEIIDVLTGFKNIAKEILKLEKKGEISRFIFGFEESNGYLLGTYARDKDAIAAAMLACEMAGYYKSKKLTLIDVLNLISEKYGFYSQKTLNFSFTEHDGLPKIKNLMKNLRNKPLQNIGNIKVLKIYDYLSSSLIDNEKKQTLKINIPKSNIFKICLAGGHEIIVRPSGTEPKIKVYIMVKETNKENANSTLESIAQNFKIL